MRAAACARVRCSVRDGVRARRYTADASRRLQVGAEEGGERGAGGAGGGQGRGSRGGKGCLLRNIKGTFIGMSESRKGITNGAETSDPTCQQRGQAEELRWKRVHVLPHSLCSCRNIYILRYWRVFMCVCDYLVKICHERALAHNDRTPNENHHVMAAFKF
jgi:hypothetical protein